MSRQYCASSFQCYALLISRLEPAQVNLAIEQKVIVFVLRGRLKASRLLEHPEPARRPNLVSACDNEYSFDSPSAFCFWHPVHSHLWPQAPYRQALLIRTTQGPLDYPYICAVSEIVAMKVCLLGVWDPLDPREAWNYHVALWVTDLEESRRAPRDIRLLLGIDP